MPQGEGLLDGDLGQQRMAGDRVCAEMSLLGLGRCGFLTHLLGTPWLFLNAFQVTFHNCDPLTA